MITHFTRLTFALLLCAAFSVPATAQDAGMSDVEVADERDYIDAEKILYSPGEAEVRYAPKMHTPVARDSSAGAAVGFRKPRPEAPSKQGARPKDESILSFNFLYYIIQKYKLQDIMD